MEGREQLVSNVCIVAGLENRSVSLLRFLRQGEASYAASNGSVRVKRTEFGGSRVRVGRSVVFDG